MISLLPKRLSRVFSSTTVQKPQFSAFPLGWPWEAQSSPRVRGKAGGCARVTAGPKRCIGEGNGNPLQCSCLESPRDWGAWWAAIYGVAELDMTEAT